MEGHNTDATQVRTSLPQFLFCLFVCLFFVFRRNVPGQALYLTSVQQVRDAIGRVFPSFARTKDAAGERLTTLVKLTPTGNLVAGAVTRTAIGFVVNPLTVVKARFEVRTRCALVLAFDGGERDGRPWPREGNVYAEHVGCRVTITGTKASSRPCNRWHAKGREHSFKDSVRLRCEMRHMQGCTLCSTRG